MTDVIAANTQNRARRMICSSRVQPQTCCSRRRWICMYFGITAFSLISISPLCTSLLPQVNLDCDKFCISTKAPFLIPVTFCYELGFANSLKHVLCKPPPHQRQMRKSLKGFCCWHCFEALLAFLFLPVKISPSNSSPLLSSPPHPLPPLPASLIMCQWGLHCISLQKANEREKKIHYGLVLRCSSQPFSPVWTSGLCCILMLQRDGREALRSLRLSALKMGEGRKKKRKNSNFFF